MVHCLARYDNLSRRLYEDQGIQVYRPGLYSDARRVRRRPELRPRKTWTNSGGFFCFRGLHIRPVWRVLNKNLNWFQFCFRRNSAFLRRKKWNQPGALIFELPAIFFALFSIYPEKWKFLTSAKTRLLKGFYNFSHRVHETHSESVKQPILPE